MTQRSKIKTAKIQCISQLKKHSFKSLLLSFEAIGISYGSEINKKKKITYPGIANSLKFLK